MAIKLKSLTVPLLLIRTVFGQNPQTHGEYRIEHPELPKNFDNFDLLEDSFWENFQYDSHEDFRKNWVTPQLEIGDASSEEKYQAFPGQWKLEEAYLVPGFKGDMSLVLGSSEQRSLIARRLPKPFSMDKNNTLVIQYEVKLQKQLECGGAYMKLFPPIDQDLISYNFSTPFELSFGPDACNPYTNEVHLVLRRTNLVTNTSEEKYLQNAPPSRLSTPLSNLYTLILDAETQNYEIRHNGEVAKAGSLLAEGAFLPPLNPPRRIPDISSTKPKSWDDRPMIADPFAEKPNDWDENQPLLIPDPLRTKPLEWNESNPEYISDPRAQKPKWWNESEDGKWVPPARNNPSCFTSKGCGKWKPRQIKNPQYKGHWEPPLIVNPRYQGEWKPSIIENPDFYVDETPAKLENKIGVIVFDLWSSSTDTLFDNIYVGHSIKEAERLGNMTFSPKLRLEKKELKMQEPDVHGIATPVMPKSDVGTGNLFDALVEKVFSAFMLLDDILKGIVFGIGLVIVVGITAIILIKIMLMTPDEENKRNSKAASNVSTQSEKTLKGETAYEKGEGSNTVTTKKENLKGAAKSTGSALDEEAEGSTLVSRKVIPLKSNDDYEEELEISVVEENDED